MSTATTMFFNIFVANQPLRVTFQTSNLDRMKHIITNKNIFYKLFYIRILYVSVSEFYIHFFVIR